MGMPSICDPGEDIVKAVKLKGFDVICIPVACAVITALISSGMPPQVLSSRVSPQKKG